MIRKLVAVSVCFLGSCGGPADHPKSAWRMPVQVDHVTERSVTEQVEAGGTLDAAEVIEITNRVAGVVERVAFQSGDTVTAGQVLIAIEPERFQIAVERARAAEQKAQAQALEARSALARRERLSDVVTPEELATSRSRLAQMEADVAVAGSGLHQAELDARDAQVRAPIAGIIESRTVRIGQFLPLGTTIATQVQRLPLRLRARVTPAQAALLAVGQEVRVAPLVGEELAARIVLVAAVGDPVSRSVEVVAQIDAAPATTIAGGFARLIATASGARNHPAIPQAALRATARGYLAYIAVREGEQLVARERLIEAGLRSPDGWVEVRSGLVAGESLIVLGADGLRDGIAIEPTVAAVPAMVAAPSPTPTPPTATP